MMRESLQLQQELGPIFDITFDWEDGAKHGDEAAHAQLIGELIASEENRFGRIGARVHDVDSEFFEPDVVVILQYAAKQLAYLVLPKAHSVAEVKSAIAVVNRHAKEQDRKSTRLNSSH